MMSFAGQNHTSHTKARLAKLQRKKWTPERREQHSKKMKAVMNDPAVRANISRGTIEGNLRSGRSLFGGLSRLTDAWKRATPAARREFLNHLADGTLNPDQPSTGSGANGV